MTTKTSISNDEILILESEKDKWAFRTHQDLYWSIKQDGSIAVDGKSRGPRYFGRKISLKVKASCSLWNIKEQRPSSEPTMEDMFLLSHSVDLSLNHQRSLPTVSLNFIS